MMKLKRLVASMLALLLAVSLLPMAAMADDPFRQDGGEIQKGQEVTYNVATDVTNYGTVINNTWGGVTESPLPVSIKDNYGTVDNNGGYDEPHKGTVENNHAGATVENNKLKGIVEHNYGLVTNNTGTVNNNESGGTVENNNEGGKVLINKKGGTVETNGGQIVTNSGTVGKKEDGQVVDGSGNNNAISANNGTVISNNESGIVGTNAATGKIEINDGTVGTFDDDRSPNDRAGNYGTIGINNKTVTFNQEDATIVTNNGKVASNYGTVETNAIDGVVYNEDTFFENAPRSNDNGDAAAPEEKPNVDGVGTNFGTVFDKTEEGTKTTYYGLSWGDNVQNLTLINGMMPGNADPVNLNDYAAKASLSGYRMTGYTAFARRNGADSQISDTTNHLMDAPVWLKIDWEKIVSIFKPAASSGGDGGAEAVKLSAGKRYIGLGSVIFINEKGYKVVEIKDDAFVVVSFDALPDEDVKDLNALFAKLFTAEQQKLIKNIGQLLDAEDVLAVFGKSGNHPVFEVNKTLVE